MSTNTSFAASTFSQSTSINVYIETARVCVCACVCLLWNLLYYLLPCIFTKDSEEVTEGRSEPKVHKAHHPNDLEEKHNTEDTVEHSKEKSGERIQENSETGKNTSTFLTAFPCYDLFLFDLIFYVPSTIFQLNRDECSWVEPVLS